MKRKMSGRTKKSLLSLALALVMLAGFFPFAISPGDKTAVAGGGPVGDVIFNLPYHWIPTTTVENITWSASAISRGYDIAYTPSASAELNGVATDAHLVMRDSAVSIYGYQTQPRMDYVFSDVYKLDSLAFTLIPYSMNFHSFSETGFLFNGRLYTGSGGV